MQRGVVVALGALLSNMFVVSVAIAASPDDPHRLYDRQTDCAVFEIASFPAEKVTWDGPCTRGLASGLGTATFLNRNNVSETISTEFSGGMVVDGKAEIAWSDGAHYSGLSKAGKPDGIGVLVDARGNRFDGEWEDGALNGHGSVVWTNGDRYVGDWIAGKAEGRGTQVWADGQKYDGQWHNDQPNGQGTLTRKDGTVLAGAFVDGKRQVATAAATDRPSPSPSTPATAPPTADATITGVQGLDRLAGLSLLAVDGSIMTFAARENALVRIMTASDGSVQKTIFMSLGSGLGTVTDTGNPPTVKGVFRATSDSIQAEYSDGHIETLAPLADGLAITSKSASGDQECVAWYPQGHVFSAEERKLAVAAYARRLGLPEVSPVAAHPSCSLKAEASPIQRRVAPAPIPGRHKPGRSQTSALASPTVVGGLQTVPVKISTVHLIDTASSRDSIDASTASTSNSDEPIASNCLKVDSDGSYWGFRNHCGYAVQYAYCLFHGTDGIAACGTNGVVSVAGSVSANGFGALFADISLGERDVEHNFRWVGCRGGSGEVAAHLDSTEPASGRCVRTGRTLAQGY